MAKLRQILIGNLPGISLIKTRLVPKSCTFNHYAMLRRNMAYKLSFFLSMTCHSLISEFCFLAKICLFLWLFICSCHLLKAIFWVVRGTAHKRHCTCVVMVESPLPGCCPGALIDWPRGSLWPPALSAQVIQNVPRQKYRLLRARDPGHSTIVKTMNVKSVRAKILLQSVLRASGVFHFLKCFLATLPQMQTCTIFLCVVPGRLVSSLKDITFQPLTGRCEVHFLT